MMDKLPMCLWMLLFPVMIDITQWIHTRWMTHDELAARYKRVRDQGLFWWLVWALGAAALYPYSQ